MTTASTTVRARNHYNISSRRGAVCKTHRWERFTAFTWTVCQGNATLREDKILYLSYVNTYIQSSIIHSPRRSHPQRCILPWGHELPHPMIVTHHLTIIWPAASVFLLGQTMNDRDHLQELCFKVFIPLRRNNRLRPPRYILLVIRLFIPAGSA